MFSRGAAGPSRALGIGPHVPDLPKPDRDCTVVETSSLHACVNEMALTGVSHASAVLHQQRALHPSMARAQCAPLVGGMQRMQPA